MNRPTVSLAVITMGEPGLKAMLESAAPVVDEVVLVCDPKHLELVRAAAPQGEHVSIHTRAWNDNFAEARAFSFEKCSGDLVLWLDSDDVLLEPELLRERIDELWEACGGEPFQLFMRYNYSQDIDGHELENQYRERVVPRVGGYWTTLVHETWQGPGRAFDAPPECFVFHANTVNPDDPEDVKRQEARTVRNFKLLDQHIKERLEAKKVPDRRLLYLYGNTLAAMGQSRAALGILAKFVRDEPAGWYKARAYLRMADCFIQERDWSEASNMAALALIQVPSAKLPYVVLFDCAIAEQRWADALYWFKQAHETGPRSSDTTLWSPTREAPNWKAAALAAAAAGLYDKAVEYAKSSFDRDLQTDLLQAHKDQRLMEWAVESMEEAELDDEKRRAFCRLLPKRVQDLAPIARHLAPAVPADRLALSIYCGTEGMGGGQTDFWGPEDLERGIGGSETMVLRLAPELVKAGAHVELYGPWRQDEERDGVHFRHYSHFDPSRRCDVFVSWRYPELLGLAPEGVSRILWMHDQPGIIGDTYETPDECWALTNDHAKNIGLVRPDWKCWVTRNGIPDFKDFDCTKVPGRVIYTSSPDRGLLTLLRWWPEIKKQRPDAELHVYYGFTKTWKNLEVKNPELRKTRTQIEKLVKVLSGVVWHGAVGQQELHKAIASSCVWAYPTKWPESSCITAMEMGALGVVPVTNNFSALAETVLPGYGTKFDVESGKAIEDYKDEFIAAVVAGADPSSGDRDAMARTYRAAYGLDTLAQSWVQHLKELRHARTNESNESADRALCPAL